MSTISENLLSRITPNQEILEDYPELEMADIQAASLYARHLVENEEIFERYDRYFKPLERPYQGGEQVELPIPHDLFSILNQYPRVLKPR
jgi:hypothetical protein